MNTKLLLIPLIVAGFASCSTAYKTAQTPDDVYFSPAPLHDDYVRSDNEENRNVYNGESTEDRSIRRTIHNRRWRRYHDYDYGYDYGYPFGYYPYGYYPYGYPPTGKPPVNNSQARKYNLGTYTNPVTTPPSSVIGSKTGNQPTTAPVRTFPQPKGTAVGNLIRNVFSGGRSNSGSYDGGSQTRTFDTKNSNSNNNNSSSGNKSSSSSSAPVRTFPKK
jgi:hypothetical protein